MPSHDDSTLNAFQSEFLQELAGHEDPPTAGEAAHGGLWRVVHRGDGKYGLYRFWETPEQGDEPFAVFDERPMALLAAAFLPLAVEARTLWSQESGDGVGQTLYRDDRAIGRVRYRDAELLDALNLAVGLVRSPVALAAVILAAGAAALEPAGKILARKVLVSEAAGH